MGQQSCVVIAERERERETFSRNETFFVRSLFHAFHSGWGKNSFSFYPLFCPIGRRGSSSFFLPPPVAFFPRILRQKLSRKRRKKEGEIKTSPPTREGGRWHRPNRIEREREKRKKRGKREESPKTSSLSFFFFSGVRREKLSLRVFGHGGRGKEERKGWLVLMDVSCCGKLGKVGGRKKGEKPISFSIMRLGRPEVPPAVEEGQMQKKFFSTHPLGKFGKFIFFRSTRKTVTPLYRYDQLPLRLFFSTSFSLFLSLRLEWEERNNQGRRRRREKFGLPPSLS